MIKNFWVGIIDTVRTFELQNVKNNSIFRQEKVENQTHKIIKTFKSAEQKS
jgi:hypothetical protein